MNVVILSQANMLRLLRDTDHIVLENMPVIWIPCIIASPHPPSTTCLLVPSYKGVPSVSPWAFLNAGEGRPRSTVRFKVLWSVGLQCSITFTEVAFSPLSTCLLLSCIWRPDRLSIVDNCSINTAILSSRWCRRSIQVFRLWWLWWSDCLRTFGGLIASRHANANTEQRDSVSNRIKHTCRPLWLSNCSKGCQRTPTNLVTNYKKHLTAVFCSGSNTYSTQWDANQVITFM